MTPLLLRVATCAGLTAFGLSARAEAQIPKAMPDSIVVNPIQRVVPAAPAAQQAAPPVVQQSPNGLYALSITDAGIELRGPSGGVKITNAGIEIGAPNTSRVTISAAGMELWGEKVLKLNARETVELVNGPGANIVRLSPAGVELVNGPGANIVRLSPAGMELTGKGSVQLKGQTVDLVSGTGPGTNTLKLSNVGVELKAGGSVDILGGSRVTLGCPGGKPAARLGDAVSVSPATGGGTITGGTIKVLICD